MNSFSIPSGWSTVEVVSRGAGLVFLGVAVQVSRQNPERMQESRNEHTGIFGRIRDGDRDSAAALVREHFEAGKGYLLANKRIGM